MFVLFISIIAFFVTTWYFRRYLDDMEIPKGMTRGMLIFTFSSLAAWGAGALVYWLKV